MADENHNHMEDIHEEGEEEEGTFIRPEDVVEEYEIDPEDLVEAEDEDAGDDDEDEAEPESSEAVEDDSAAGFFGHTDAVYAVKFVPNTPLIVSGGGDDLAYSWFAESGEEHAVLGSGVFKDSVTDCKVSFDGKYVAISNLDGTVGVWENEGENLKPVVHLDGPGDGVNWLNWHSKGNFLLAGTEDYTVWMWSIPNGKPVHVLAGHSGSVTCGAFTVDGKSIVTGSDDGSLILWSPKTGQSLHTLRYGNSGAFHEDGITCLDVREGNMVLSGAQDGTTCLSQMDPERSRIVQCWRSAPAASDEMADPISIEAVAFAPAGGLPLAATGGTDGRISLIDLNSLTPRATLVHNEGVSKLLWHPTNPYLLFSAGLDGVSRLWDSRTSSMVREFRGHSNMILCMDVDSSGSKLVTGSDDNACLVFDL